MKPAHFTPLSSEARSDKGHGFEFSALKLEHSKAEALIRFQGDIGAGVMPQTRRNKLDRQQEKSRGR